MTSFFRISTALDKTTQVIVNYLKLITDLHFNAHSGTQTNVIFIAFAKAFDTAPHGRLLLGLSHLQIGPSIVEWIAAFLHGRSQSVRLDDTLSSKLPVTSGIP